MAQHGLDELFVDLGVSQSRFKTGGRTRRGRGEISGSSNARDIQSKLTVPGKGGYLFWKQKMDP